MFNEIYNLVNSSEPVTCRLYPPSYNQHELQANAIEMALGTAIKVICFLLPLVIPLTAFWIPFSQAKPCQSKVSQLNNLNFNESFGSHEEDGNFWRSLKFKSKATEKSSKDEFLFPQSAEPVKEEGLPINTNHAKKSQNNNFSRSSETEEEEEKSPISVIRLLNGNLQKSLQKKSKVVFSEYKS